MSAMSASKSPPASGLSATSAALPSRSWPESSQSSCLRTRLTRLLDARGGQASDRHVGQRVLAVHRCEPGIGDGPQVRGLRPQRGQRRGGRAAHEVARVVARVAEQQHVARRRPRPGVEREREELANRLACGLAAAEDGSDLLERHGARGQALAAPPLEQRLRGGEESALGSRAGSRPGSRRRAAWRPSVAPRAASAARGPRRPDTGGPPAPGSARRPATPRSR